MPRLILGVLSLPSASKNASVWREMKGAMFAEILRLLLFTDALIKGEFPDDMRIGYRKPHMANRKKL